jgi:hypothetical protein
LKTREDKENFPNIARADPRIIKTDSGREVQGTLALSGKFQPTFLKVCDSVICTT